ncbi:NAD-dependent epimerase/dehydratase family protein [Magnetospirillum gryphiswaldense]|uniref:UDP-glucose 4-epimerase n=1 Tax=Magnetospirillum gryphiswaldense TaxID=55518 RepID=A4TZ28_9PROT|nr:NAD(P)-dependent oxidoreductase [Magnetospirillum gryphiswaldense]CAM75885.1 UDP-glucose 4-epimerase [Magnetospirillum gryphiswaldense MSR-1]
MAKNSSSAPSSARPSCLGISFVSPNAISDGEGGVLVTGGAGFVGTVLVGLLRQHQPVVVVDDLSVGRPMPAQTDGLICYQADIRDRQAMIAIMECHRPASLVHLAAIHHIPTCERDPFHATDVNVMGFQSVLDACAKTGCRHVVLASSGAVYDWHDGPLAENAALAPQDVYAASKAANEHQLAAWAKAGRGAGIIARMFNVIGPNDPNGHLIPDLLRRMDAAPGGPLTLRMGNLDRRRDFVDVNDMAAGLACLVGRHSTDIDVYNLCSGREYSASDIALRLAAHRGAQVELFSDPALCRVMDRTSQLGDPGKSFRDFGWRADRDLDDSIAAIVRTWTAN